MSNYTQTNRPLAITTPLGKDVLLLTGFKGHETISRLFNFQLDLLAERGKEIRFDQILGQQVTVEIRLVNGQMRYFNGLIKRFSQGARDESFIRFRAELVPKLWLLTKKVRCRIFQQLTAPDILRRILSELDVTYEISGTYYPRDYCVQYRESDFDFASRLMEEEGIYYFFKHSKGSHQMVVTDVPNRHPSIPEQTEVVYEELSGAERNDMRITAWEKSQELRSGEYTLWDHCFELPGKHLEAKRKTIDGVMIGEVNHKLAVGGNDQLEIYDYPGGYAQRFDGIDHNGAPRPQDLQNIFPDSERTVKVRMEQEETASLRIIGASDCGHFAAGHQFTLKRHFDADDSYLLTSVEHDAHLEGNYRSSQAEAFNYTNNFSCIPVALPYRPQRLTRKPGIAGIQTATVVGPSSEELFCDKYGRVKVQFHWDREGKKDANSSCWLRVAQVWAGKGWGAFFWPRIGHEVVVVFEEGDPDQPLIIGSVYNAQNMPPFVLPKSKKIGGFKSASVRGNAHKNFNGIIFVDTKDHEHLAIHSERHMVFNAEYDKEFWSGRNHGERVPGARTITVGGFPGGGGSGGGPNTSYFWPQPDPQAVFGLNSSVVYGGNFQIAMPLNFQVALGSNLQICVNPIGFATELVGNTLPLPPTAAEVLGSGLGGNMQLTLGTSANFVMGQIFDINVGPRRIEINADSGSLYQMMAKLIGYTLSCVIIVFLIAYALVKSDALRASLLLIFQVTTQLLLFVMMNFQQLNKDTHHKLMTKLYRNLFVTSDPDKEHKEGVAVALLDKGWGDVALGGAIVTLLVAPPIVESLGEKNRDNRTD